MQGPEIHANEAERLASLESIGLTREREARFSELVELGDAQFPAPGLTVGGTDGGELPVATLGRAFPHTLMAGAVPSYFNQLKYTPFLDDLTLDFVFEL